MPDTPLPLWWNILDIIGFVVIATGVGALLYAFLPKMNMVAVLNAALIRPIYLITLRATNQVERTYKHQQVRTA